MTKPTLKSHSMSHLLVATFLLAICPVVSAQIEVDGLEDREFYTDRVTFTVLEAAGFEISATLNGHPWPVGESTRVEQPDYYELEILAREIETDELSSETIQFIVRNGERGRSESGLPSWVPLPPIDSATDEWAGAIPHLIHPSRIPAGFPVPVVAWLRLEDGKRTGLLGRVPLEGFEEGDLQILRGVGSRLLTPATAPGAELLSWSLSLPGQLLERTLEIDPAPTWVTPPTSISEDTTWPADTWVRIPDDLTVEDGVTLTVAPGGFIALGDGVSLRIDGSLRVEGTATRPVIFAPLDPDEPWGGLEFWNSTSEGHLSHAIITGSGANDDWFDDVSGTGSSHRDEQPALFLDEDATVTLVDSAIIDSHGQAGHGEDAFFTLERTLVQRAVTVGQYNGGVVTVRDSALIEFPALDAPFADDDNDGLYLTGGAHVLEDSLIGWALDDGVDAGSGSGGAVTVRGCWFEACYHEGMAWSESRDARVSDTVAINCGQGLECGFDDPEVVATNCLLTANLVGARFGDNYDWDYEGSLEVTDSLLLFNERDIWGRAWDDWTVHLDQMSLTGNLLTDADGDHPDNLVWDPENTEHELGLLPFLDTAPGARGVGIATWTERVDFQSLRLGLPVRLSSFSTAPSTVSCEVIRPGGSARSISLEFRPGQTLAHLDLREDLETAPGVTVRLLESEGLEFTGLTEVTVVDLEPIVLVPEGSTWKYRDDRVNLGTAWREFDHDDAGWPEGPAELGFGDDDEATELEGGPSDDRTPTFYFRHAFEVADPGDFEELEFRLRRDDGGVVYLNGVELFRSNMPEGEISYETYTGETTDSEDDFFTHVVSPEELRTGRNVLAVEIHQADDESSDISFELELLGRPVLPDLTSPEPIFLRGDVDDDGSINIGDPLGVLLHLFRGAPTDCPDALDLDDSGTIELTDVIRGLGYLFLGDAAPPAPFPVAGIDPTPDALADCERS